ncbi:unnamed protein product [Symbiodinium necroappetens]|uniref:Uncharacterized protein n=1 Tax=Symbiodinium necroappetens TaxID=1628268 RepID=A0A812W960_9DINO|nr:unnamed protein product [Symbiodinium necroappetens]
MVMLNLNAKSRAMVASAAAARDGKEFPGSETSRTSRSRPSSAKRSSRPASAGSKPASDLYSYDAFLGNAGKSSSGWRVAWKVPRSFLEIAASQPTEWLNLKWGPKEFDFREAGARLEADAQQAAAHEAKQARDGKLRRRRAEQFARQQKQSSSGEPWRPCSHGGRQAAIPHLPGRRFKCMPGHNSSYGLFSDVPPLSASEAGMLRADGPQVSQRSRPASAQPSTRRAPAPI